MRLTAIAHPSAPGSSGGRFFHDLHNILKRFNTTSTVDPSCPGAPIGNAMLDPSAASPGTTVGFLLVMIVTVHGQPEC